MRFWKPFFAAAALCAAIVGAPVASAQPSQSATVIVVEYERIVGTSDVGRSLTSQLQAIGQAMQNEIQPEATAIEAEQTRLQQVAQGKTPEQIRADRTLSGQIDALGQRVEAFRARQVGLARDMEYTRQMSLAEFNRQITPVVRQVMESRGAGAVLDASSTQLFAPSLNATDDVIARLNQSVRSITVTRQSAPAQQQQGGAPPTR